MTEALRPNTMFFLMAQYGGRPVIPLEEVCRDYFSHLPVDKFLRKVSGGQIRIPVVQMEPSQKSHKGIHIHDLADYIDQQREAAVSDFKKIYGR